MEIVVYSQYYRSRTPDQQLEIDARLRRNLNHPGISQGPLEVCPSSAGSPPSAAVWWERPAPQHWPPRSKPLLLQPI